MSWGNSGNEDSMCKGPETGRSVCVCTELIEENEERGRWGGWRERKDPERKTL